MTEIKHYWQNGEPVCDDGCPYYEDIDRSKHVDSPYLVAGICGVTDKRIGQIDSPCAPGLRQQRAELTLRAKKAEAALKKAGCPCCDAYHFPAGDNLVARLAYAEAAVEEMREWFGQWNYELIKDLPNMDTVTARAYDFRELNRILHKQRGEG